MNYTILVIEAIKPSLLEAVKKLSIDYPELGTPELVLLTSRPEKYTQYSPAIRIISADYSPDSLKRSISDLQPAIKAVVCRGDVNVQYLRRVIPYLPPGLPVAPEQSLAASTNKRLMRQAFLDTYPEITPHYIQVAKAGDATTDRVMRALKFPVIIKPASLASSLLIQKCRNREELSAALVETFAELHKVYEREGRTEEPEVIVEEFLEGDFYSIDSYVLGAGHIVHCPPVHYVPANTLGIDDFFLYKRDIPTTLEGEAIDEAYETAAKAIRAVGLQYSSVHVELVRTAHGWKVIELGPRIGRFRNIMYTEAYGIDHGYNDILIHLGLEPIVPKKLQKYCAAYSIYPTAEGVLESITSIDGVHQLSGIRYFKISAKKGEMVKRAKNGGHALSEVIIASDDKVAFERDCQWIEENVKAITTEETR